MDLEAALSYVGTYSTQVIQEMEIVVATAEPLAVELSAAEITVEIEQKTNKLTVFGFRLFRKSRETKGGEEKPNGKAGGEAG